ncbi:hypothetical protein GGH91_004983, partial [Coemansia sp. RSA 2671]
RDASPSCCTGGAPRTGGGQRHRRHRRWRHRGSCCHVGNRHAANVPAGQRPVQRHVQRGQGLGIAGDNSGRGALAVVLAHAQFRAARKEPAQEGRQQEAHRGWGAGADCGHVPGGGRSGSVRRPMRHAPGVAQRPVVRDVRGGHLQPLRVAGDGLAQGARGREAGGGLRRRIRGHRGPAAAPGGQPGRDPPAQRPAGRSQRRGGRGVQRRPGRRRPAGAAGRRPRGGGAGASRGRAGAAQRRVHGLAQGPGGRAGRRAAH